MSPLTYSLFDLGCNGSFLYQKKNTSKICQRLDTEYFVLQFGFLDFFSYSFDVWSTKTFYFGVNTCLFYLFACFQFYFILLMPPILPNPGLDPAGLSGPLGALHGGPRSHLRPHHRRLLHRGWWPGVYLWYFLCLQQHNLVSQVLTASSGATLTVPTAAILAGKAVAIKGLLLKTLANWAGEWRKETGYMCNKRPLAY